MTAGLIVTDGFGKPQGSVLEHGRVDDFDKGMLRFQFGDQVAQAPLGVEGQANLIPGLLILRFPILLAQSIGLFKQLVVKPIGNARLAIEHGGFS